MTPERAIAIANAALLDPKVAACRRTYERAMEMYKGGGFAGGDGVGRMAVMQAKAAWQKALREFTADSADLA